MNESCEKELARLLNDILAANRKLLEYIKEERQHIIHNNLAEIERLTGAKAALFTVLAGLEERRHRILEQFAASYTLTGTVRLDDLIAVVPEPYASEYRRLQQQLRGLLGNIHIAHETNRRLIQRSLDFHERTFALLMGLMHEKGQYKANGKQQVHKKQLFDSRV